MFLKNFFGQLKTVKDKSYKKRDKSKEKLINLNKFEKYYYHSKDKEIENVKDEEINLLLNKLKRKYSPQKIKDEKTKLDETKNTKVKFLTEINQNNSYIFNKKIKNKLERQNLFKYNYHLNELSRKLDREKKII